MILTLNLPDVDMIGRPVCQSTVSLSQTFPFFAGFREQLSCRTKEESGNVRLLYPS